jgi:hypothetical protein
VSGPALGLTGYREMYPLRVKLTTIPLSRAEIKNGGAISLLPHTPLWPGDLLTKYRVAVIIIIITLIIIIAIPVVFNLGYAYPRGYVKTSYGYEN